MTTPRKPRRPRVTPDQLQGEPPPPAEPDPPDVLTGRQLVERAQAIGRESDLYYQAHLGRWPTRPSLWTVDQRRAAEAFLQGFIRPDGTAQPVPHRRSKSR